MVFSIDIDSDIDGKFDHFKNVSFFIDPSSTILPTLLQELDNENIPIEFIFIDGDNYVEGLKCNIDFYLIIFLRNHFL